MLYRKIIYFITILITAFIVIMYPGSVPPVLLGLEICYAVGSILFLIFVVSGFQLKIEKIKQIVFANEEWKIPIVAKNSSWLPIPYAKLYFLTYNHMSKKKTLQTVFLKLPARDQLETELIMKSEFCGIVEVQAKSCRIYEPFCLFGWTKKRLGSYQQIVLPKLTELKIECMDQNRYFITDAKEYDNTKPGEDPSEILRFRDYLPGDRMSQINWKLSARKNTLFVKERSLPLGCIVELAVDTRYTSLKQADALLQTLYSLSWAFVEQKIRHCISWYQEGSIVSYNIIKEEEILEVIKMLMLVPAQVKNWQLEAWTQRNNIIYERILLTDFIRGEEADFIFHQPNSKRNVLFLIQEEERDNQKLKEQYGEDCYEIHVPNIENELPSIWLVI